VEKSEEASLMERNVAILRYEPGTNSVARAISLCEGANDLKSHYKIMIKPNVVLGGRVFKSFIKGCVVNAGLLEEIIVFLKEFGCSDITIGEGSVLLPELSADTESAFEYSGVAELARRHEVKLMDFYKHPFEKVELGGKKIEVSLPVLEADYIINVPVLKTHNQTRVSLSIKNLKGCLSYKSKKSFHNFGLENYIAMLGAYIKPQLNIVDGLYTINNGPTSLDYQEVGVVLAGADPLAVDIVGTMILGINPAEVGHIKEYAAITGGSLDISTIDVRGESIGSVKVETRWNEPPWPKEFMQIHNVKGVDMPTPGPSLCSSCGFGLSRVIFMLFREIAGQTLDQVAIYFGDEKAPPGFKQYFLLGKCGIKANRHIPDAIKIKGCPPNINECLKTLKEHLAITV
jgi:uncharacterized protein (DUF362 family)